MNPRKVTIDGIEVVVVGCDECPLHGMNDEMGDEWCQHPLTNDYDTDKIPRTVYESFPDFCLLKEVKL